MKRKEVFDSTLGRHGGTTHRGKDGRFASNPSKGKSWYCHKSPTGAHHWTIIGYEGRCKYCRTLREFRAPAPLVSVPRKRSFDISLRSEETEF